jgi:tRNA(adenine34) deaminase
MPVFDHAYFMQQALRQALLAQESGEIPVGAVVVLGQQVIGRGYNQTERLRDVTAHAELLALTAAANFLGNKYLTDCTLYVTVEPCVMCAGASYWSQLRELVFGTEELKHGFRRHGSKLLHPRTIVTSGVLADDCASLMRNFFNSLRK